MYSLLKWHPGKSEAPVDQILLIYVEDTTGDSTWKYITIGWQTRAGEWIMDNEYIIGNIIAWANLPKPENMFVED